MNDDLVRIFAEQLADDAAVSAGDVQSEFFADDANPGLRDDQVNAGHLGTGVESRKQPLRIYRAARSGDACGNGLHCLCLLGAVAQPELMGNYIGRCESLSSRALAAIKPAVIGCFNSSELM